MLPLNLPPRHLLCPLRQAHTWALSKCPAPAYLGARDWVVGEGREGTHLKEKKELVCSSRQSPECRYALPSPWTNFKLPA